MTNQVRPATIAVLKARNPANQGQPEIHGFSVTMRSNAVAFTPST